MFGKVIDRLAAPVASVPRTWKLSTDASRSLPGAIPGSAKGSGMPFQDVFENPTTSPAMLFAGAPDRRTWKVWSIIGCPSTSITMPLEVLPYGVAPGEVEVTASTSCAEARASWMPSPSRSAARTFGSLRGQLLLEFAGARVELVPGDARQQRVPPGLLLATVGNDGTFALDPVLPGGWVVQVTPTSQAPRRVDVMVIAGEETNCRFPDGGPGTAGDLSAADRPS